MTRYFAFLRGVNVGGHTIKMAELRDGLTDLGFTDVETFIASGNLIFEGGRAKDATIEKKVEAHLEATYGFEVPTFVRTDAELAAVDAHEPFPEWEHSDDFTYHVGFLRSKATAKQKAEVEALSGEVDRLTVHGRELYWMVRGGFSDSKLARGNPDRQVGELTVRNVKTIRRLSDKYLDA